MVMPSRNPCGLIFWPTSPSPPSIPKSLQSQRTSRRMPSLQMFFGRRLLGRRFVSGCFLGRRLLGRRLRGSLLGRCRTRGLAGLRATRAGGARGLRTPRVLARTALDDHGDVAGALADPESAALGARPDPLGGRAAVGVDRGDHQGRRVEPIVVLRVGRSARDDLGHRLAGRLRRPAQDVQRFGHRLAANQVDHPARLGRRHPHEPRHGGRRRIFSSRAHRRLAFRSSLMCPLKVRVGANSPSLCPTIDSVTNTGTCLRPSWTAKV